MDEKVKIRTDTLRRRGNPGVAPLWATGSDIEFLCALGVDPGEPWVNLLKADTLISRGMVAEALIVLQSMEYVPEGLKDLRDKMAERAWRVVPGSPENSGAERLNAWLANVRLWREKKLS